MVWVNIQEPVLNLLHCFFLQLDLKKCFNVNMIAFK